MPLLYHAYVYLEFLILACTIYILAPKIDSGKWRSLDGTRQFRVKPDDYLGNHGIGQPTVPNTPHVHFEFLTPKSNGNGFDVIKNIHVPIK